MRDITYRHSVTNTNGARGQRKSTGEDFQKSTFPHPIVTHNRNAIALTEIIREVF